MHMEKLAKFPFVPINEWKIWILSIRVTTLFPYTFECVRGIEVVNISQGGMKSGSPWFVGGFLWYAEGRWGGYEPLATCGVTVHVFANHSSQGKHLAAHWTSHWLARVQICDSYHLKHN